MTSAGAGEGSIAQATNSLDRAILVLDLAAFGEPAAFTGAVGALVRMKAPIPFDAPDGQGVSLIFLLMVPDRATDQHLQILAELAEMFSDKPFRELLMTAEAAIDIHALIANWSSHAPN